MSTLDEFSRILMRMHGHANAEQRGKEFRWLVSQWDDAVWLKPSTPEKKAKAEEKLRRWAKANEFFAGVARIEFRRIVNTEPLIAPASMRALMLLAVLGEDKESIERMISDAAERTKFP